MSKFAFSILLLSFAALSCAFSPNYPRINLKKSRSVFAVTEVNSETEFDAAVKGSGSALVVIDYSTTWCGPCKVVLPKFVELSEKYTNVVFLKCIGDLTPEAGKLMKREGVRSVPSFHFWKNGAKASLLLSNIFKKLN